MNVSFPGMELRIHPLWLSLGIGNVYEKSEATQSAKDRFGTETPKNCNPWLQREVDFQSEN